MSLIIRGVNLPKKCGNCPCYDYIDYICLADDCEAGFDVENPEERSEHCPLVKIPTPHGRLIDADELLKTIEENSYMLRNYISSTEKGMFLTGIRQAIDEASTIIEAEVSE